MTWVNDQALQLREALQVRGCDLSETDARNLIRFKRSEVATAMRIQPRSAQMYFGGQQLQKLADSLASQAECLAPVSAPIPQPRPARQLVAGGKS